MLCYMVKLVFGKGAAVCTDLCCLPRNRVSACQFVRARVCVCVCLYMQHIINRFIWIEISLNPSAYAFATSKETQRARGREY